MIDQYITTNFALRKAAELTHIEYEIIELIRINGNTRADRLVNLSAKDLAEVIGISQRQAQRAIKVLVQKDYLFTHYRHKMVSTKYLKLVKNNSVRLRQDVVVDYDNKSQRLRQDVVVDYDNKSQRLRQDVVAYSNKGIKTNEGIKEEVEKAATTSNSSLENSKKITTSLDTQKESKKEKNSAKKEKAESENTNTKPPHLQVSEKMQRWLGTEIGKSSLQALLQTIQKRYTEKQILTMVLKWSTYRASRNPHMAKQDEYSLWSSLSNWIAGEWDREQPKTSKPKIVSMNKGYSNPDKYKGSAERLRQLQEAERLRKSNI